MATYGFVALPATKAAAQAFLPQIDQAGEWAASLRGGGQALAGWINLGAGVSDDFRMLASRAAEKSDEVYNLRDRVGRTFLHELEHVGWPPDYAHQDRWFVTLNRVEEGTATTLGWWPGRLAPV